MINDFQKIVIKVGTSSLTYDNGKINLKHLDNLCKIISDLQNSGRKIILVSSGAIGVGVGKLGLSKRPEDTSKKQALAAIGQCELMNMYGKMFGEYGRIVAQVLLTAEDIHSETSIKNIQNTFSELLSMDIIPIVNENDTVATAELEGKNFGDNDNLSAIVSVLTNADDLIIFTDIDGLYDSDPKSNPNAKLISEVVDITEDIINNSGGAGTSRGTGGMHSKVKAAKLATENGTQTYILNGDHPEYLYDVMEGESVGTKFIAKK